MNKTPLDSQLDFVKEDGLSIRTIPKKHHTKQLCMEAINQNVESYKYFSKKVFDKEMIELILSKKPIQKKNKQLSNLYAIIIDIVSREGDLDRQVFETSKEFLINSLDEDGCMIVCFPKEEQTEEICLKALSDYGLALQYIHKDNINYKYCNYAIERSGLFLEFVPLEFRDFNICLKAVKLYGNAIEYVPECLITNEIVDECLKENPFSIRLIPEKLITKEICEKAVTLCGQTIIHVPNKFLSTDICEKAIKSDNLEIYFNHPLLEIPLDILTEDLCLIAVKTKGSNIKHVPEIFKTNKVIIESLKSDSISIFHIDKDVVNIENIIFYSNIIDTEIVDTFIENKTITKIEISNAGLNLLTKHIGINNINNKYIFPNDTDLEILKEIALSNNELILVGQNFTESQNILANHTIKI